MEIESYHSEHKQAIIELLIGPIYKAPLWEWQFGRESNQQIPSLVAISDERVIGFNGLMPVQVNHFGHSLDAVWSCDFVVDGSFRRQGVGRELKRRLGRLNPVRMSLGISDKAVSVLAKSGWKPASSVNSFLLINHPRRSKERFILLMQHLIKLYWRVKSVAVTHVDRVGDVVVEERLPNAEQIDNLWHEIKGEYCRCVVRNYSYLQWRYSLMPAARYIYLTIGKGSLRAMAVIRINHVTSTFVDYLGPSQDLSLKASLFDKWLKLSRHSLQMRITTSDSQFGTLARQSGGRCLGPQRFYIQGADWDLNDWFIMSGDSDGEFLQAIKATADLE